MFKFKTEDTNLQTQNENLIVSQINKLRIVYRFFPNKKILKFIKKGKEKLAHEFDISDFAKKIKNDHNYVQK